MSPRPSGFVIVGTQRTGTSLIRTTLDSHPDIRCHGEVFKLGKNPYTQAGGYWQFKRRSVFDRVKSVLQPAASMDDYLRVLYAGDVTLTIGFKLMLSQYERFPFLWSLLSSRGVSAIWVRRDNVLKTLVSRRAARESGIYHVSESLQVGGSVKQKVRTPVELQVDRLLEDLESIDAESVRWKGLLRSAVKHIEVGYEVYVEDPEASNHAILEFLGVKEARLHSDLMKVNPERLQDVIINYESVAKLLKGSRFAFCLEQ